MCNAAETLKRRLDLLHQIISQSYSNIFILSYILALDLFTVPLNPSNRSCYYAAIFCGYNLWGGSFVFDFFSRNFPLPSGMVEGPVNLEIL